MTDKVSMTLRQSEVLSLLAQGYDYNDITALLGIKHRTVWLHVRSLKDIFEQYTIHGIVGEAFRRGLLEIKGGEICLGHPYSWEK